MASLTKKIIRGRPYYYLRECKRVDGKPKIVWQKYLGSAADLVCRLTETPTPASALVREFGASAACFDIAQELDIVGIVDRHLPKRGTRGPSVGEYLLIAALNRCLAPRSKSRLGAWYQGTVLPRLVSVRSSQLTSQRFWDNMSRVDEDAITSIEHDLAQAAVTQFGLDLHCLLFDATNFFSFVDSFDLRCELPQRGHSKEGRDSLRIVGLALLVTADGDVPLFHHCYAGNQHDSTTFATVIPKIAHRCREISQGAADITLVFDKGNNSQENLTAVAGQQIHFVGSLVPTHHPELLAIGRDEMRRLDKAQLPAVWSHRTKKVLFGVERTVLVTFNRPLFRAQLKTLRREVNKRQRKLERLRVSLERGAHRNAGKKATLDGTRKRVDGLLAARHMKELFTVEVRQGREELPEISWSFNNTGWEQLKRTLLGKTILFTDRAEWTDEQIVRYYRSQAHVESAFRGMKDPRCLAFRPVHHWTDQKLRVHALYCVMALMVLALLRRKLAKAQFSTSFAHMVEQLSDIREVTALFQDEDAKRPRSSCTLSELNAEQQKMLHALGLARYRVP